MPEQKKAFIETYGCQMNISDTELMHGILAESGYASTDNPEDADVILVNTCAIRDHAEQRVIGRVGQLQQYRRQGAVIGVTGCMAQRMGADLLGRSGGVDLVMGPDAYRQLPEKLAALRPPAPAPAPRSFALPVMGAPAKGLTVLGFLTLGRSSARLVAAILLFGVGVEIAQAMLPTGRTGSVLDALANAAGSSLVWAGWVWRSRRQAQRGS